MTDLRARNGPGQRSWSRRRLLATSAASLSAGMMAALTGSVFGSGPALAAPAVLPLALRAIAGSRALRGPGEPPSPVSILEGAGEPVVVRLPLGEPVDFTFANGLPEAVALQWLGLPLPNSLEPLATLAPLAPGTTQPLTIPALSHPGSGLVHARLLEDGRPLPLPARPVIVAPRVQDAGIREACLFFEDWRLMPDGQTLPPGRAELSDSQPHLTVNGVLQEDIPLRRGDRLLLRFISGAHRTPLAVQVEGHDLIVVAIDGKPAEPFMARTGRIVLAPATRVDCVIDAGGGPGSTSLIRVHDGAAVRTVARLIYGPESGASPRTDPPAPLVRPDLPQRFDWRGALRAELPFEGLRPTGGPLSWQLPGDLRFEAAPAFRAAPGRSVVLALTNRTSQPCVFHLHGHPFRLLDRLDDGWKPFWLDTLLVDAGQTARIAFVADQTGRWLIEAYAAVWDAPRLVRWYQIG